MMKKKAFITIAVSVLLLLLVSCATTKAKLKMDPESEEFYLYARYLMTRNESKIFSKLNSPEQRRDFIESFWSIRNFSEDENENDFKEEILKRVDHAKKYFRDGVIPGLKSDRGMVHIIMGPANNVEKYYAGARYGEAILPNNTIMWYYRDNTGAESIRFVFVDRSGTGIFRLNLSASSMELLTAMDRIKNFTFNKKEGPVSGKLIKFAADYSDPSLAVSVNIRNVSFDRAGDRAKSRFTINLVAYLPDGKFSKKKFNKEVINSSAEVLNKLETIDFKLDIGSYPRGTQLDLTVVDSIGSSVYRRVIKVK